MWWVAGRSHVHFIATLWSNLQKCARFQAKLKFPSWTECGNTKHVLFDKKNKRRHFKGVKEARKEGALGLQILSQENISCHRKTFPVTRGHFHSQKEISCQRKKFPVTGTISCQRKKFHLKRQNFKLQEEIFSDKKKFPVTDRKFLLKEIIIYQRKKFSASIKRLTKLNQYFVLMTHCQ